MPKEKKQNESILLLVPSGGKQEAFELTKKVLDASASIVDSIYPLDQEWQKMWNKKHGSFMSVLLSEYRGIRIHEYFYFVFHIVHLLSSKISLSGKISRVLAKVFFGSTLKKQIYFYNPDRVVSLIAKEKCYEISSIVSKKNIEIEYVC
ncbi:MAG: hypothetical protein KDK51_00455 [Deltaproteobacteria bacterium]|nr:hypothetical protein [Deltaproteobacteria bacterium]